MSDSYICAKCGGTFDVVPGAEAEAKAEANKLYPGIGKEEMAVICDDCYEEFIAFVNAGGLRHLGVIGVDPVLGFIKVPVD